MTKTKTKTKKKSLIHGGAAGPVKALPEVNGLTAKRQIEIALLAKNKAFAMLQTLCDEPWPELTPEEFEAMKPILRVKIRASVGNAVTGLPFG